MVDPEAAREAARDILAGPDYSEPPKGLVERVVEWVFERLGDLASALTGGGAGSLVGWIVVIALVVVATGLLARALRVAPLTQTAAGDGLRYGTEPRRDAGAWLDEGARLAAAGDLRGALRCRYQAVLARVVDAGVVDDVPGRTPGEYRSSLAERLPSEVDAVDQVTARFEAVWFGGEEVDGPVLAAFTARCERIEAGALEAPLAVAR